MKNKLAVMLLLLFAVYMVIDLLFPLYEQQQYFDSNIKLYVEGISA